MKAVLSKNDSLTPVQTKLKIGSANDKYEREANAMANRIMRMPQSFSSQPLSHGADTIQRKCAACEKEDEIQRKPLMMKSEGGTPVATPALGAQLSSSKGSGSPLPSATSSFMSQAFGTDFSHVRVHTGTRAAQMNQGLNARAFTHGSDVYFNRGQYNPYTREGKHLLAHELTHTIQQNAQSSLTQAPLKLQRKIGSIKLNGCNQAPYTDATVLKAAETAKNVVATSNPSCIGSPDLKHSILSQFSRLKIDCEKKGSICGKAFRHFSDTINLYPPAITSSGCGKLESTILHEVVHLTEFQFAGHGPVAEACENSCFGSGSPSKCKKLTAIEIGVSLPVKDGFTPDGAATNIEFRHSLSQRVDAQLRPFIFAETGKNRLSAGVGATLDSFWLPLYIGGRARINTDWFRNIEVGASVEAGLAIGNGNVVRLGVKQEIWKDLTNQQKAEKVTNFVLRFAY